MAFYTEGEDLYRWCKRVPESKEPREALNTKRANRYNAGADTRRMCRGRLVSPPKTVPMCISPPPVCWPSNENGNKEKAEAGAGNLYEWHDGKTIFIARLSTENEYDEYDWRDFYSPNLGVAT